MPKRGCDVTSCEVAKCFKLVAKGYCEPISFKVPRKVVLYSPSFISIDLYNFRSELKSLLLSLVANWSVIICGFHSMT